VNAAGQLGTAPSSARFKDDIKPMDKASEAILALKPVTFHYKQEIGSDCTPQFGLVAEDVAKVNPDLIVRDKNGEVYTVRYDAVNAMLLNEFLKEHREVQELKKQVATLTAGLQKIGAQHPRRKQFRKIKGNKAEAEPGAYPRGSAR
jgi:trimeric autotransporter adhesin